MLFFSKEHIFLYYEVVIPCIIYIFKHIKDGVVILV